MFVWVMLRFRKHDRILQAVKFVLRVINVSNMNAITPFFDWLNTRAVIASLTEDNIQENHERFI